MCVEEPNDPPQDGAQAAPPPAQNAARDKETRRLAQALRENLKRRKNQARLRSRPDDPPGD